jgi:hypothetical protein
LLGLRAAAGGGSGAGVSRLRAVLAAASGWCYHCGSAGIEVPGKGICLMTTTDQEGLSSANAEAIEAWDGPLFDRFVRYRQIV